MHISVKVKTNAKRSEVKRISENSYIVSVVAKPVKGEANKEVVQLLAKYFEVKKVQVILVAGHKVREKVFEVIR